MVLLVAVFVGPSSWLLRCWSCVSRARVVASPDLTELEAREVRLTQGITAALRASLRPAGGLGSGGCVILPLVASRLLLGLLVAFLGILLSVVARDILIGGVLRPAGGLGVLGVGIPLGRAGKPRLEAVSSFYGGGLLFDVVVMLGHDLS